MKLKVWILFHRWDGDESSNLHATKEAAEEAIQSYVMDQWEEGVMDDEEMPNDPNDAVQRYFEYHEDMEWYNIYSQKVDFPDLEIPDEEVVLTANECAIVVMALELEGLPVLAVGTGLAPDEEKADEWIQSAYQKLKD